jgi:hypothetical protein
MGKKKKTSRKNKGYIVVRDGVETKRPNPPGKKEREINSLDEKQESVTINREEETK